MNTVAIKKELIIWARERSGIEMEYLIRRFPKYHLWENEVVYPTLRQLESLARITLTPLGFFFLHEPPDDSLPIPDFRTVGDQPVRRPSPNLLETVQIMQRRQNWMRDFLLEEGENPLQFVGSVTIGENIKDVVFSMRKVLGLTENWAKKFATWTDALKGLREATENAGILPVFNSVVGNNTHRHLDKNEFRGFVLKDEYAPLIFINSADFKAAQMFTIVHELAHIWLGCSGVFNLRALEPVDDATEIYCNRVAAEFLVPENELRAIWNNARNNTEPFQFLARQFKVSPLVIARRALDLGFINRNDFYEFYKAYQEDTNRKKENKSESGDFYNTQNVRVGKRFALAVMRAAKEGKLLYRDAYQLTGLYGNTFDRYREMLGVK